jgi:uncharacterized protein (DUF2237 family)
MLIIWKAAIQKKKKKKKKRCGSGWSLSRPALTNHQGEKKKKVEKMSRVPPALNVLGGPLAPCCMSPRGGFFRDGFCRTDPASDRGVHTVCAVMTADFLVYTASRGNDLATPVPAFQFPGLQPGDRWCLCAARWEEARRAGHAPPVILAGTHAATLAIVEIEHLEAHEWREHVPDR